MAIDPLSYATRNPTPFRLGRLPHRDMVFPTWPKMAKTAKIGRNGPHSRSHISMVMATNDLTNIAIDTSDRGAGYMLHVNHLNPLQPFFPSAEKWYTKNGERQHSPY